MPANVTINLSREQDIFSYKITGTGPSCDQAALVREFVRKSTPEHTPDYLKALFQEKARRLRHSSDPHTEAFMQVLKELGVIGE